MTTGSDFARLPQNVYVCQTCGTGQGYIWPMASDGDDSHHFVERCDLCLRFSSDEAAADYIVAQLTKEGYAFERGHKDINDYPQPYIENVAPGGD